VGPRGEGGDDEAGNRMPIGARNHGLGVELSVACSGGVGAADEDPIAWLRCPASEGRLPLRASAVGEAPVGMI
jgi:hypothetical protein